MNMPGLLKIKLNKAIKLFVTINFQFSVLDDKSNLKKEHAHSRLNIQYQQILKH